MSNQIISQHNRAVPPGAIDVWSQSQSGTALGHAAPPTPQTSPVQKAHRLLRGKMILAVVLGLAGGAVGAFFGAMSQPPQYRAVGTLEIKPTIPTVEGEKTYPYYQQFMASQSNTIISPKVLNEVPKTEPWKSSPFAGDKQAFGQLGALKTEYKRGTFNIVVQLDAEDAQLASIGVQSVIHAYRDQFKNLTSNDLNRKINELEARQRDLESQSRSAQQLIADITSKYGSADLEPRVTDAQKFVTDTARELRGNENNLKAAVGAITAMRDGGAKTPIEELAQVDAALAAMLQELRANQFKLQTTMANFGPNHPKVKEMKLQLDALSRAAEEYADTLRKEILAIIPDFVKGQGAFMKVTPGQLRVLEQRVAQLKADLTEFEKQRDSFAADAGRVAGYRLTIKDAQDDQTKVRQMLEDYRFRAVAMGELEVMNDGRYASQVQNKKVMFGLLGGILGCAIPVGALMLLGLMDTRFKYSDDAAGDSMSGIPLLGILPNLPDRLSDPAQASIAAHCVHQIRTMLQLNAMRQDGSTVFSITSASSGDGKTSLSLALGLSFAASGSRTLLIDADLVGGGLTSRLGNNAPLGIVDALAGVSMEDCIQPTDVADLSILPIGSAQAHHAGGFSPPAVRKLLAEARKRYEVIIIDTGPVMGSIEATPICASVDGVVLTVARGQSRPLVERAITHLTSIGARVAGVVFNRAQHKDFEQSIGAISIRSAARSTVNGSGHNARNPGDIGAVAKAVATSVRSDNN